MSEIGWVRLHRKIRECSIWDSDEPFDMRSAWLDLVMLVNYEDKRTIFNKKAITIKKGQRITSVRKLSDRWHWSRNKTIRFLTLLESEKMIIKESDNRKTLLTIVNYDKYQGQWDTDETTDETTDGTQYKNKRNKKKKNSLWSGTAKSNDLDEFIKRGGFS